ncbi:MAG: hypothetical protein JSU06_02920 [Actinobacteria bacterium]|nr:hypothetical protein [Actinomycetota bacterium]
MIVPTMVGVPPYITHEPDCGRIGWPVNDAVKYEDGLTATINDWPNGIDHETGRDIAEPDETDARAYVTTSGRDLIRELRTLELLTQGGRTLDETQMLDCIDVEGPADEDEIVEAAEDRLFSMPLAVEATTTFEVVLGCGGPDRRLCFECDVDSRVIERGENVLQSVGYEVRRVLYRYSWDRSAEIELAGEDREVAEAFGRRVVPELVE